MDDDVVVQGDVLDQGQGDLLAYSGQLDHGEITVAQFDHAGGNG